MSAKNKAFRLCSLYFFSLFTASVLVNLAFISPRPVASLDNTASENNIDKLLRLEIELAASELPIEGEDMTGVGEIIEKKRNRRKQREEKLANRQTYQKNTQLVLDETLEKAKKQLMAATVKANPIPSKNTETAALPNQPAQAVELDSEDPHPANGRYSKNFVPMDKDIAALPVKYSEASKKFSEGDIRTTIIDKAKKHLGTRYVWSGKKPGGFDCSGFTSYMLNEYGISLSPSSRHQGLQGDKISLDNAKTGDLVFFSRYGKGGRISHVALVVENQGDKLYVIHACSRGIVIDDILNDKYWKPKILYARNVITGKEKSAVADSKS